MHPLQGLELHLSHHHARFKLTAADFLSTFSQLSLSGVRQLGMPSRFLWFMFTDSTSPVKTLCARSSSNFHRNEQHTHHILQRVLKSILAVNKSLAPHIAPPAHINKPSSASKMFYVCVCVFHARSMIHSVMHTKVTNYRTTISRSQRSSPRFVLPQFNRRSSLTRRYRRDDADDKLHRHASRPAQS